ncbi:MAG: type II toxin-antitoxin system RelE/ParE family toxin [Bacteroidia bacterium]|nr:type II toxin-antitoxin system RelE/ParE family toxin [Bacteroidia bacterium]
MAEVILTRVARQDLIDIEDYVSEQSPSRTQALINKLLDRITILETLPQAGPKIPELDNDELRQLVEGSYRILYRIASEETIYILRFLHNRRQLEL